LQSSFKSKGCARDWGQDFGGDWFSLRQAKHYKIELCLWIPNFANSDQCFESLRKMLICIRNLSNGKEKYTQLTLSNCTSLWTNWLLNTLWYVEGVKVAAWCQIINFLYLFVSFLKMHHLQEGFVCFNSSISLDE